MNRMDRSLLFILGSMLFFPLQADCQTPAKPTPHLEEMVFGMALTRGPKGHRVTSVYSNSPADHAGVRAGDLLVLIGNANVTRWTTEELAGFLQRKDTYNMVLQTQAGDRKPVELSKIPVGSLVDAPGGLRYSGKTLDLGEVSAGQAAPEIEATGNTGRTLRLSELAGKVVLVHFTSVSERNDPQEWESLRKIHLSLQPKGFEILSVYLDTKQEEVKKHRQQHQVNWPFHYDGRGWNNAVARAWGVPALPTNALIDPQGRVSQTNVPLPQLSAAVEKLQPR
jgi:peroxiredoxin